MYMEVHVQCKGTCAINIYIKYIKHYQHEIATF